MLNIGIIGCGHWGANHVRVFYHSESAKVKVCCDKDAQRLNALHKIYPDLSIATDYNAVLDDESIDAVIISTPTATHYQLIKEALSRGKHVFCEKPLAIRSTETKELESLTKKFKLVLMVGYVFLFNNGIISLKEYIEKKKLGRILYLNFTRTNLGPIRNDVDVIYDLASHDIAIASFLLNSWPKAVSANAGYFLRKDISDLAFITLYYPNNVLVNIHVSWLDPGKIRRLVCVGDEKMAIWDDLSVSEPVRIYDKGVIKEPYYSDYGEFQLLPRDGEVVSPFIKLVEPLKKQNSHFIDCVSNNAAPLTDVKFGHKVTLILESAESSLKNKGLIRKIT